MSSPPTSADSWRCVFPRYVNGPSISPRLLEERGDKMQSATFDQERDGRLLGGVEVSPVPYQQYRGLLDAPRFDGPGLFPVGVLEVEIDVPNVLAARLNRPQATVPRAPEDARLWWWGASDVELVQDLGHEAVEAAVRAGQGCYGSA